MSKFINLMYSIFLLFFISGIAFAQQSGEVPVKVRQEIAEYGLTTGQAKREAKRLGIDITNPEQAAAKARAMGLPESKIQELLQSAEQTINVENQEGDSLWQQDLKAFDIREMTKEVSQDTIKQVYEDEIEEIKAKEEVQKPELKYFGYDLFENIPEAFQPTETGPVDEGYLVGPGDVLRLVVWGATEFQYELAVDKEGRIYVPGVGQTTIGNKSLSKCRESMKRWLSRKYQGLEAKPPTIFMDLTVTRLRPIRVFVLGEVARPGGYTISSYSTIFNVLYSVGGPLTRGSLRDIQLIRNGKIITSVDLYDYLLKGHTNKSIRLQNNDHIFIPLRGKTVAISGQVNRSAIYELKGNENVSNLINYAGGLKPEAYMKRFQIERIIPYKERKDPSIAKKVIDENLTDVIEGKGIIDLADGDKVKIFSILDIFENVVKIDGSVYQPGTYELGGSLQTVKDLIMKADSLTGEAYLPKAELYRLNLDGSERLITLNLEKALANDSYNNIYLQREDSLRIFSVHEIEYGNRVSISGKVRNPGYYFLVDSMTVYDLLFKGGGLLDREYLRDVYLERADLVRQADNNVKKKIIPFNLKEVLEKKGISNMFLRPQDQIIIYPVDVKEFRNQYVTINGFVKKPGKYWFRENMNLKDLILQAGGYKEEAYLSEIEVNRPVYSGSEEKSLDKYKKFTIQLPSLKGFDDVDFSVDSMAASLEELRRFRLEPRDVVFVRKNPNYKEEEMVKIEGEVLFPGEYTILYEGETLSRLLKRAGGLTSKAYPGGGRFYRRGERLIASLDKIASGHKKEDMALLNGDRIVIPEKPNVVEVKGNVNIEGLIKFREGKNVISYLDFAGGVKNETEDIFITYPNGRTKILKRFLGHAITNPKVTDGSMIFVAKKLPKEGKEKVDIKGTITESMALLSSALTIIILARNL
ncbi:MAG TPA: sugar transporter [Candidatus Marinimicrobia bacterium]|nr:sugar transporter [Candidatus Neomarinimicrobiota bacterium]